MRITCPNCDAQYEVDDRALPAAGRDVQCSNCGHAWFQLHPEAEARLAADEETFGSGEDETVIAPEAPPLGDEDEADTPPAAEGPRRRAAFDDDVLAVLREEAERESAARRAEEGSGLETQPELGLEETRDRSAAIARAEAARRRMAEMRAAPEPAPAAGDDGHDLFEDEPAAAEPPPISRRNLLPDIEEINSSLRSNAARPRSEAAGGSAATAGGGGFRLGFLLTVLVAIAGAAAYVAAPMLSARVPALAAPLAAYVAAVDQARLWLDGLMRQAAASLSSGK